MLLFLKWIMLNLYPWWKVIVARGAGRGISLILQLWWLLSNPAGQHEGHHLELSWLGCATNISKRSREIKSKLGFKNAVWMDYSSEGCQRAGGLGLL